MTTAAIHKGRQALHPKDLAAIVKTLKAGRMPRSDTRLGRLCRQVEAGLFADLDDVTTARALKIGLVLQLVVLIAGLPLFDGSGKRPHPGYRWAVDSLLALLGELDRSGPPSKKPSRQGINLEDLLNGSGEDEED